MILAVMLLFIIKLLDTFVLWDAVCNILSNILPTLCIFYNCISCILQLIPKNTVVVVKGTEPIKIKFLQQYQGVFFLAKPGPSAELWFEKNKDPPV